MKRLGLSVVTAAPLLFGSVLCIAAATMFVRTASAGSIVVYWADDLGEAGQLRREGNIGPAEFGGTKEIVVNNLGNPRDVAVDLVNGKLFWSDGPNRKIQRANLDGSEIEDVITDVGPKDITLDVAGGKVLLGKIMRANLDGSAAEVVRGLPAGDSVSGIALDVANDMIYWGTTVSGLSGSIHRKALSVPGPTERVVYSNRHGPTWLDIDTRTGDIYWVSEVTDTIVRNDDDVIVSGTGEIRGMALDVSGRKIYWSNSGGAIKRSGTNNGHVTNRSTGAAGHAVSTGENVAAKQLDRWWPGRVLQLRFATRLPRWSLLAFKLIHPQPEHIHHVGELEQFPAEYEVVRSVIQVQVHCHSSAYRSFFRHRSNPCAWETKSAETHVTKP